MYTNIYSSPEKFGLEVFAELEYSGMNYMFDTLVVWKDFEGNLFYAQDSGCSCPIPFETFDLSNITPLLNYRNFEIQVASKGFYDGGDKSDMHPFLKKIREYMR